METQRKQVSIGRIVYVHRPTGEYRPAIVVSVWNRKSGCVNAVCFLDGSNDLDGSADKLTEWQTSIVHGSGVGEWLWPEELPENAELGGPMSVAASAQESK